MKAESYLRNIKSKYQHGNDWFQVKPGTAAVAVAETTPVEAMQIALELVITALEAANKALRMAMRAFKVWRVCFDTKTIRRLSTRRRVHLRNVVTSS